MPTRSMTETMDQIAGFLDDFDALLRRAHERYRAFKDEDLPDLDARAQAACTYSFAVAEADRRFMGQPDIRPLDLRGLKVWLFESANAVFRFKKMDEDGKSRNYQTEQAKDYDIGNDLPGLPMPPVRLTVGYVLDSLSVNYTRTQIARPRGNKSIMWCAAVVPMTDRKPGERIWTQIQDVLR